MRHILIYIATISLWVLPACAGENQPNDILTQQEMVPVLKDMQVGYAGVDLVATSARERNELYGQTNEAVLKKHSIDQDLFYRSYSHFQQDPVLMDTLLAQVLKTLKADLDSTRKEPVRAVPPKRIFLR